MFNYSALTKKTTVKTSILSIAFSLTFSSANLQASDLKNDEVEKKLSVSSCVSSNGGHGYGQDIQDLMAKVKFHGTVIVSNNYRKKACVELVHEAQDGRGHPSIFDVIGGVVHRIEDFFGANNNNNAPATSRSGMNPGYAWIEPDNLTVIKDFNPRESKLKLLTKKAFLNLVSVSHDAVLLSIDDVQLPVYPRPLADFGFVPKLFEPIAELPDWVRNSPDKILKLCPQYPPNDNMSPLEFKKEFDSHIITIAYIIAPQEGIQDVGEIYKKREALFSLYNINSLLKTPLINAPLRIPAITHTIWLTNPAKPVEFPEDYLKWLLQSVKVMPVSEGWQHCLWIQNKHFLPKTKKALKGTGVEIKEIYTDATSSEIKDLPKFGTRKLFEDAMSKCRFGMASDIFRLEILKRFGGIYKDTDYIFDQNPYTLMQMYDSFYGIEPMSTFLCNALMACKPKHPITKASIRLIERNFNPRVAPDYVLNIPEDDGYLTIASTGPIVTMLAFHEGAGKEGNRDVAFPPEVLYPAKIAGLYPQKEIVTEDNALPETSVGKHLWQGAWVKKAPKEDKYGSNG